MSTTSKKKKSILGVGYKLLGVPDAAVKWLVSTEAGGREYSYDPRGDSQDIYADGIKVFGDSSNDGYDISLTLLDIIDDVSKDWLNEVVDTNGRAEYADVAEYPYFELYIIENTRDAVGKTTIFTYCQCSGRPSETGKTSEGSGNFDYFFPEYSIAATPRPSDMLVKYVVDGKARFTTVPTPPEKVTPTTTSGTAQTGDTTQTGDTSGGN